MDSAGVLPPWDDPVRGMGRRSSQDWRHPEVQPGSEDGGPSENSIDWWKGFAADPGFRPRVIATGLGWLYEDLNFSCENL